MSKEQYQRTDVIGIVTLGFFLLLVGGIFVVTPNLLDRISDFLHDLEIREIIPHVTLPAPKSNHPVLYTAIFEFCLAFAIFQVFVLAARLFLKDPVDKQAGTISSLVFWFGASWIVSLLIAKDIGWFVFFGGAIALIGVSLVTKNAIILVARVFS